MADHVTPGGTAPDRSGGALAGNRFLVAAAFVIFVALTGGGSRSDIASVATLRGGSVLFAAYALWVMPPGALRALRAPLILLAALACWMVVQLIPLPADWWVTLPGRDMVHRLDILLGQADLARPISLTPALTVNSLLSLVVPLAAILLFATLAANELQKLFIIFIAVAVASMLIGILQIWIAAPNPFYFYRITNQGSMVGLFSNRNHHAMFLALVLVLVGLVQRQAIIDHGRRPLAHLSLVPAAFLMVIVNIGIGSLGGLAAGLVGLAAYTALVWPPLFQRFGAAELPQGRQASRRSSDVPAIAKALPMRRAALVAVPFILLAALVALFFFSEQSNAINRSTAESYAEDLRGQTLPVIIALIKTHWLLGSGFGSFAPLYASVEPDGLLQPEYFNHAHNDWAQLVIEGGLPMALIVLFGLTWALACCGRMLLRGLKAPTGGVFPMAMALSAIIVILVASSAADYPLRTPSMMVAAALAVVLLARFSAPSAGEAGQ